MMIVCAGLRLMFSLMDRVPDGISPMLHDLEDHINSAGLADMMAAADIITTVCIHPCLSGILIHKRDRMA